MFGKSTEKRVMREADKIISLKEDMDAISWTRVLEIGKLLQEGVEEADRVALARELVSIAQSNRTLNARLGIEAAPSSGHVMASGIEVMEGGLAEAAIEEQVESKALPAADEQHATTPEPVEPAEPAEPRVSVPVVEAHHAYEPSEIDFQAAEVRMECELVAKNDPDEDDFIEAAQAVMSEDAEPESEPEPEPTAPSEPVTLEQLLAATQAQARERIPRRSVSWARWGRPLLAARRALRPPPSARPRLPQAPAPAPEPEPAPEPQSAAEPEPAPAPRPAKKRRFARFRNLYESRDGGLCVFEDEHGHLVAVDSSKLA